MNQISPWMNLYREYTALFGQDPEVQLALDEENYTIKLYVASAEKADALSKILPMSYNFGNIDVKIIVVYPNGTRSTKQLFQDAFEGNPAFCNTLAREDPLPATFVIFEPEVVQYKNDNLFSYNGMRTTVYEDIARDIFQVPGVYFNTEDK